MKLSEKEKVRLRTAYGPWALVTGASSGIGLELSRLLASAGFDVVVHGRRALLLQRLAEEFTKQYGVQTVVVSSDLSTEEGVHEVSTVTADKDIGLFVGSAGFGTSGLFHQSKLEDEIVMLRVNVDALLRLTHHFSQRFVARGKGGIILLSSMVSFQGVPYAAHYASTKAYVQSLGEALAHELMPYGVDVLTAAPGPVRSGFESRAGLHMNLTMKPEQIAVPILKALGKESTLLPGLLTKVLVGALRTVPRWGKVMIMQKVMGGMTAHQRS
ncbi:MAG: SDR family NAD(P)-dependent oxidoreductase [Cyclobacteriaceae bacterium]|jgi:hypothetical protein|nr:SDR family NAD(P)-dependent oxidoreductase [Cyclobacteriaceae bacterium]